MMLSYCIIVASLVTPLYTNHNSVPGDVNVMTNMSEWASSVESSIGSGSYTWIRPDDWTLGYSMSNTEKTVTSAYASTDSSYRVISNIVSTVKHGHAGTIYLNILDPTTQVVSPIDEYFAVSSGIVVNASSGTFSTDSDGLFKVGARRGSDVRYTDVPVQIMSGSRSDKVSYYADDVSGSDRKSVNDAALAVLNAATFVQSNQWTDARGVHNYAVYNTFQPRMTETGAGNVTPFAVSQHVLASCKHYSPSIRWTGNQTFNDGQGNTAIVNKREWVVLAEWAKTNGFSEAQIAEADIDDLALIRCNKTTAVPDGCIPKFMSEFAMKRIFGESMRGVCAWLHGQQFKYAVPIVMVDEHTFRRSPWYYDPWQDPETGHYGFSRADVCKRLSQMGLQYWIHSGDSGKPVFVNIGGSPVILTTVAYGSVGTGYGANYVKGYQIIKAFVEDYGDTLKGIEQ